MTFGPVAPSIVQYHMYLNRDLHQVMNTCSIAAPHKGVVPQLDRDKPSSDRVQCSMLGGCMDSSETALKHPWQFTLTPSQLK